jgi:hypothetical protein
VIIGEMHVEHCRKLLGKEAEGLSDAEIQKMTDLCSTLAGVVMEAFSELNEIDQSKFHPPGDVIDQLNELQSQTENAG